MPVRIDTIPIGSGVTDATRLGEMSYGLSAFLITKHEALILGRRDFDLCEETIGAMSQRFDEYDGMLDPEEENVVSHRAALREIFTGTINCPEYASTYGWAYEVYCSYIGERLNSNPFIPCHYEWYGELDEILESRNIPLRFAQLVDDCPISLPEPDDWPCMGHWSRDTIDQARFAVETLSGTLEDQDVANAICAVSEWFAHASSRPESMIVGFHG